MAAALAPHVGLVGDVTYSTNNGLIEVVPVGISKATGVDEVAGPLGITAEPTWSPSVTCPTTSRCCSGPGLGIAMGNAHPEAKFRRPTR